MENLLREYLPILSFIGIACAMLVASLVIARQKTDPEKLSPYKCGFDSFEDARGRFDVRFYLVAIFFIIIDLEVAFLFPWAVAFGDVGIFGFWFMVIFLGVLTIGFVYEWRIYIKDKLLSNGDRLEHEIAANLELDAPYS